MERTRSEDANVTRTVYVYEESGEWESSAARRCASGQLAAIGAPGSWRAGADRGAPLRDRAERVVLPVMTTADIACESDEIQFGLRCGPAGTSLLTFASARGPGAEGNAFVPASAYDACIAHLDEFTPQQRRSVHLNSGERAATVPSRTGAGTAASPAAPAPKPSREDYSRTSD